MLKKALAPISLAAGLSATGAMVVLPGQAGSPHSPFEGTWRVVGTPDDGGSFVNYASINAQGAFVNVDPLVGGGVGEVFRSGPLQYTVVFYGFYDPNTSYKVTGDVSLAGSDAFGGSFITELFDLDGNFLGSYQGTVEATRVID